MKSKILTTQGSQINSCCSDCAKRPVNGILEDFLSGKEGAALTTIEITISPVSMIYLGITAIASIYLAKRL